MRSASKNSRILVADDNEDILIATQVLLTNHFKEITTVNEASDIMKQLHKDAYAIVLLDMNFAQGAVDGEEGLNLLRQIKASFPQVQVILMTAYAGVNIAVEAMKLGASDFIVKPWHNERLLATLFSVLESHQQNQKIQILKDTQKTLMLDARKGFDLLIGESQSMLELKDMIADCANTDASILITGESGTGKEVVANCIHEESLRSAESFISVDMGAITDSLFESEMFGHVKGAFSGAYANKVGRFVSANHGTLFLDELGNLPYASQVKLLRVLQERTVTPVGGKESFDIDIRLISATNENLQQAINGGEFRQDLLYRINTIELHLPPLRERKEDIPLLAEHFLNLYAQKYKKPTLSLSNEAKYQLHDWRWPGNVRELQHMLERAVILSKNELMDFSRMLALSEGSDYDSSEAADITVPAAEFTSLQEAEKQTIINALNQTNSNICKAAKMLGINRSSLYRKKLKHGIE